MPDGPEPWLADALIVGAIVPQILALSALALGLRRRTPERARAAMSIALVAMLLSMGLGAFGAFYGQAIARRGGVVPDAHEWSDRPLDGGGIMEGISAASQIAWETHRVERLGLAIFTIGSFLPVCVLLLFSIGRSLIVHGPPAWWTPSRARRLKRLGQRTAAAALVLPWTGLGALVNARLDDRRPHTQSEASRYCGTEVPQESPNFVGAREDEMPGEAPRRAPEERSRCDGVVRHRTGDVLWLGLGSGRTRVFFGRRSFSAPFAVESRTDVDVECTAIDDVWRTRNGFVVLSRDRPSYEASLRFYSRDGELVDHVSASVPGGASIHTFVADDADGVLLSYTRGQREILLRLAARREPRRILSIDDPLRDIMRLTTADTRTHLCISLAPVVLVGEESVPKVWPIRRATLQAERPPFGVGRLVAIALALIVTASVFVRAHRAGRWLRKLRRRERLVGVVGEVDGEFTLTQSDGVTVRVDAASATCVGDGASSERVVFVRTDRSSAASYRDPAIATVEAELVVDGNHTEADHRLEAEYRKRMRSSLALAWLSVTIAVIAMLL